MLTDVGRPDQVRGVQAMTRTFQTGWLMVYVGAIGRVEWQDTLALTLRVRSREWLRQTRMCDQFTSATARRAAQAPDS
jgi:hypothetical protein